MNTGELTTFTAEQQRRFDSSTSPAERKERGHFGTPPAIAEFMAGMFTAIPANLVRVLDPGAGVGTLSAAVCQKVLALSGPTRRLYFELWENDPKLVAILEATMRRCQESLRGAGHDMTFSVRTDDFILANTGRSLFDGGPQPAFDLAILNPPYFKLRKDSPQAHAMGHVVHGQPNIYALFMAVAADLLLPQGEIVAITPRSYFNGTYFRRFRKWFFDRMVPRQIHVFESRTEAFKDDAVLQENVILSAEKGGKPRDVVLSSSLGRDLEEIERSSVPYGRIVDDTHGDHVIRVATNSLDRDVAESIDALPLRFRDLGLEISTGPVVPFRFTEFLRQDRSNDTAPLLWMHNVRPFITQFPKTTDKPTHIEVSKQSQKLLLPSRTYVLLKRFTSKEERRRLVAGILTPADSYSPWVGLENHLNYIYRKGSEITQDEALGLAAFFNSALVDGYFRAISGNTQVNAAEIRAMPMPRAETLKQIGEDVERIGVSDQAGIEAIVGRALRLSPHLIDQLIEVA